MQNRIIDGLLAQAGHDHLAPTLEANSMIVLFSHIRTRQWATVMPIRLAETLGLERSPARSRSSSPVRSTRSASSFQTVRSPRRWRQR
jgi:hypothetical protein